MSVCDQLITCSQESYGVCLCLRVCVCDLETSTKRRPRPKSGCSASEDIFYSSDIGEQCNAFINTGIGRAKCIDQSQTFFIKIKCKDKTKNVTCKVQIV